MWNAAADALAFENDVASFHKEHKNGEQFSLLFIKMAQGATALEAFKETIRCIWDATYQFIAFAELLLNEFPGGPQLERYLEIVINLFNGNPLLHSNMQRYVSFSASKISIAKYESLDQEFEFVYQVLLKDY